MTGRPGFTGGTLDRADHLRRDDAALAALATDWRARLLRLNALDPEIDGDGRLVWTSLADADPAAELVFLGLGERDVPHFAAFNAGDPIVAGRSPALFQMLGMMQDAEAANYASARSLIDWHSRHRFCPRCGGVTEMIRGGWARRCTACGAEHYPRVDPVVIMLATRDGQALLGRQSAWPTGRYSALAGFVEVGETVEEAVARELFEESGIRVDGVRYLASQPWPFPSSLMIACIADAREGAIAIDSDELEDARWFTRDDVCAALSGDPHAPFLPPPPYAIAHTLLSAWAAMDD